MRKLASTAALTIAVLSMTVLGATPAQAGDGIGADWTHGGPGATTVLQTWGRFASIVDTARVTHNHANFDNMCGRQSRLTGVSETGARYSKTFGWDAACIPIAFFNQGSIGARFWVNTYVTGQAYHDRAWAPGYPNIQILSR